MQKLTIGLFGFGVVGEGIFEVLNNTPSLCATIKKICILHPDKKRKAPGELFTSDREEILCDPEINVIVELIDDAEAALDITRAALSKGKAVVSANKKMIAEHLEELLVLQKKYGVPFLYEAAVCGSVPVIRNLEEYYDNDMLKGIRGIVNGSTNFMLSRMNAGGVSYADALCEAQQAGFAESDPTLDVSGRDALNKLVILLLHAYGTRTEPHKLLCRGISLLHPSDSVVAGERGWRIKLVATALKLKCGKVAAFVLPEFVRNPDPLFQVQNEFNGVLIESQLADQQFLFGKGAGRYPTSSAVLSDIAALRYDYRYEYRKLSSGLTPSLTQDLYLKIYVGFNSWNEVNKWDFETISEFHSTADRQYLVGTIHLEKLRNAEWFHDGSAPVILMPEGIIEKRAVLEHSLKKISLQLAGV